MSQVEPMTAEQAGARAAGPGGAVLLEARGVHKTYRLGKVLVPVLRGVDVSVREGEFVAILGASGSGKSTLMHLLGGLDRVDARGPGGAGSGAGGDGVGGIRPGGEVRFRGTALHDLGSRGLDRYRRQSVGFVFQFYHLLPELTVLENVTIASMIRLGRLGYLSRRGEVRGRATALLTGFGLSARLGHRPAELSGGERQRVAIARALINEPAVLLADEPTGNLDQTTGRAILDELAAHRARQGLTVVMVTHDREVAARADRVVRLVDGRLA